MSVESKIMDCEMRISQYEADINEGYLNLGKAYYEAHAEATEQTGEFAELVKGISDCFSKIEIEKQIKLIVRGKRICFDCGALLTADSLFCNKCGHKLEELPKEVLKAMEEDDDDDSEEYDVDFSVTSEEEKEEGFSAEPASEEITLEDVATEEAVEETVSPRIIAPLVFEYKEEPVSVVTEQPSEAEENIEITSEDDIIGVPDDEVFSAQAESEPESPVDNTPVADSEPVVNEPVEPSVTPQFKFCMECGTKLKMDDMFCPECGTRQ